MLRRFVLLITVVFFGSQVYSQTLEQLKDKNIHYLIAYGKEQYFGKGIDNKYSFIIDFGQTNVGYAVTALNSDLKLTDSSSFLKDNTNRTMLFNSPVHFLNTLYENGWELSHELSSRFNNIELDRQPNAETNRGKISNRFYIFLLKKRE